MNFRLLYGKRMQVKTSNLWLVDVSYTVLWCALLLWASFSPRSFWVAGPEPLSRVSQIMSVCAIVTPLFIPFAIYFPAMQADLSVDSTASIQSHVYLRRVAVCFLLTLIPILSAYLLVAFMNWLGMRGWARVTPTIFGNSFLSFVVSFTLVTSTTAVGLGMSRSRRLHLIALAIALLVVVLPFLLSEMVTGTNFLQHSIRLVQAVEASISFSIFLLFFSLITGGFFSWLYGHKHCKQTKA